MKIGETILKLREEKKMSQEEFAQYYHVTRQTISNWEKEKNYPDLQTLVKISDESGVPLDSIRFTLRMSMASRLAMFRRLLQIRPAITVQKELSVVSLI